mmetsp:Transcript_95651/g.292517  ORF Transcript_95651/g.292517 Transcript_95651/m.292517 type:complete len:259 (+) Transcript_95651:123-899(+)
MCVLRSAKLPPLRPCNTPRTQWKSIAQSNENGMAADAFPSMKRNLPPSATRLNMSLSPCIAPKLHKAACASRQSDDDGEACVPTSAACIPNQSSCRWLSKQDKHNAVVRLANSRLGYKVLLSRKAAATSRSLQGVSPMVSASAGSGYASSTTITAIRFSNVTTPRTKVCSSGIKEPACRKSKSTAQARSVRLVSPRATSSARGSCAPKCRISFWTTDLRKAGVACPSRAKAWAMLGAPTSGSTSAAISEASAALKMAR